MLERMRVLLIDDDLSMHDALRPEFEALNCELDCAADGVLGLKTALSGNYGLILLDMELPGLEGVEVCKEIRAKLETPIIMISQKADELSKILLLEIGADDYITKPYAVRELKARFKALMRRLEKRRLEPTSAAVLSYRGIQINFSKRLVTRGGTAVDLTSNEFDLLALLASEPGRAFSRETMLQTIYGYDASNFNRSITNFINRIRHKLGDEPENPVFIRTVRGHGYCFADFGSE